MRYSLSYQFADLLSNKMSYLHPCRASFYVIITNVLFVDSSKLTPTTTHRLIVKKLINTSSVLDCMYTANKQSKMCQRTVLFASLWEVRVAGQYYSSCDRVADKLPRLPGNRSAQTTPDKNM